MVKYHHLMMEEVMCDMLVVLTLIPRHTIFFLLSVWSPCYTLCTKKKGFPLLRLGSSSDINFYMGMQNG